MVALERDYLFRVRPAIVVNVGELIYFEGVEKAVQTSIKNHGEKCLRLISVSTIFQVIFVILFL